MRELRQAATGGVPGLEELVATASDELVRLAARVVGNTAEAEDVVQDAWAKALVALRNRELDGVAAVKTWLYRVVLNGAFNARRSQDRRVERELAWQQRRASASVGAIEAAEALRRLAAMLDDLPDEQASALVLKELHGMTAGEVARVLECSEGAVEQRLVRARAALRKRFE
jgi:RNA polymerase sigma-70 factor (ECF subfamily)